MHFTASLFLWSLAKSMILSNLQVSCLAVLKGTKVAIRFDKFEWIIHNKFGHVNEVYVSQSNGSDLLNVAITFNFNFIIQKLSFEIIKCKEHYIDCVNYRTLEIAQFCGNEKAILHFVKIGYINRELMCTIKKELYMMKNGTINIENVVGSFALSFDKWWEKSWKWKFNFFSHNDSFIMQSNGQLRYLLLRSQTSRYSR
ncbi:uncharacterized protein LOC126895899 [Daktulosphaira vitifoliae]|uniref:uncharacterized protein LOC126895899 n=1 Tax=Daktulosphaira vitifoliae TaxID=58002 RepID=UPI0021A9B9A7|nr:uncharacterized protein LOC126895899 [Daktulosphaira vitifoliae]XP_050524183.1 uncharacterized protein LOC126895899 [Daktulosphaira vitifoliae]